MKELSIVGDIAPTELAAALGMSTGATSTVLDRLKAAGYARREPDPDHRRRTLVRITSRTEQLSEAIFAPVIRGTIEQASGYPDAVLTAIAEFLSAHSALLSRYLTEAPPADASAGSSALADARTHGSAFTAQFRSLRRVTT